MNRLLALTSCLVVTVLTLTSCSHFRPNPPPRVLTITQFKCSCDDSVKEAVQDAFLDVFFKSTNAQIVRADKGELRIVGTIISDEGATGTGEAFAYGNIGGGKGSSAAGAYISGITLQVYEGETMIATHSIGQDLGRGVLYSPVSMGSQAARYVMSVLMKQQKIGRRER